MFIINTNFDLKAPSFNFSRDYFASIDDLNAVKDSWNDWFPKYFITNVGGTLYQFNGENFVEFLKAGGNYVSASTYATEKAALEKKIDANTESINSLANNKADNTVATTTSNGLMSAADKTKLDGLSNADMTGATASAAGTHGLVPAPAAGKQTSFLRGDGTWVVPTNTNTTYIFENGSAGTFTVTPSGGTAQTVSIGKPATAGTADKATTADSATIAETLQIPANKADTGNAIVIGTYASGAVLSGGGIGPGTFTPTETMVADAEGYFSFGVDNAKSAVTADSADRVGNALTIKSLVPAGEPNAGALDSGTTYNGSAAVSLEAITFAEIDTLIK